MMCHAIFIFKMFHQFIALVTTVLKIIKTESPECDYISFFFITCKCRASKNLLEIRTGGGVSGLGNLGGRGV